MSLIEKEIYEFGPFSLDAAEHVISRDGTPLSLTPKVFDTLLCLVRNRGRLLTKDELLKKIWPDTFVEEVNLAVNISTLRKAFGENPQDGRYIATVPGKGYRFVAEVREISSEGGNEPGAIAALGVNPSMPERESVLGGRQESNGGGIVTPSSARRSRAWKLGVSAATLLLLATAVGSYFRSGQKKKNVSAAGPPSIAVLPFVDLSPGKDQEYFSDGLAEELINDLAKIPGVRVVARSSAFQFKGKNEDLRSVGQKLGVANVVEGSVRREGDRVRITAELIKADDGFQLWSATYDRKIDDVFKVQDEIARATTGALRVELLGSSSETFVPSERPANSQAYQAYLQAQAFFGSGEDKGNFDRALASADEAIKLDPNYAPAWALRSYVRNVMAAYSMTDMAGGYARARQDAERAVALNPRLATGYLALGWIQIMHDWDWEGAEGSLEKAAELDPAALRSCATGPRWLGLWAGRTRRSNSIRRWLRWIRCAPGLTRPSDFNFTQQDDMTKPMPCCKEHWS
jgi:TolB-like protein/DNA-binding winged helix-turn-helix (wHTH) protein